MKDRIKALCKKKGVSMNTAEKEIGLAKDFFFQLVNGNAFFLGIFSDIFF